MNKFHHSQQIDFVDNLFTQLCFVGNYFTFHVRSHLWKHVCIRWVLSLQVHLTKSIIFFLTWNPFQISWPLTMNHVLNSSELVIVLRLISFYYSYTLISNNFEFVHLMFSSNSNRFPWSLYNWRFFYWISKFNSCGF